MAWRAKLESISDPTVPTDEVIVNLTFRETITGKTYTKQYQFNSGSLESLAALKDFAAAEVQKLNRFDNTRAKLAGAIGQDL